MKKWQRVCIVLSLVLGVFKMFPSESYCLTNQWTNAFNNYWHNENNWTLGHIPLSGENVIIPYISSGMGPGIYSNDEECLSLTIDAGTGVEIYNQTLTVNGQLNIHGVLELSDPHAKLICDTDIFWHSGSEAIIAGAGQLNVSGVWDFQSGADVQLDDGWVNFVGSSVGYIRSRESNCYFHHVRIDKINGYVGHSSLSTAPLKIKGNLIISIAAELRSFTPQSIQIEGYIFNEGGEINLQEGTIEFFAGDVVHYLQPGDHFNHVIINAGGSIIFEFGVDIGGCLSIVQGELIIGEDPIVMK